MMSSSGELLTPGGMFGDFKVIRELGKGGMGAVYLVEDTEGSQFAVKIVDPAMAEKDPEFIARFIREGEFARDLNHPNLIAVYDMGQDPDTGYCYLVMDYLSGGDVHQRLAEHGRFPIDEAVRIVAQVANALVAAHRLGVVHRDIKPGNIMFDSEGVPRLADLGIAKFEDSKATVLTSDGVMIGTPAYMAPEQIIDSHSVDARADIYSLGIVLFEMLTGKRPNEGETVMGIVAKAVKGEPIPDVRTFRPEVPATIAQLLNMMCAPKREQRIGSASEVVKIFTRYFNRAVNGNDLPAGRVVAGGQGRRARRRGFMPFYRVFRRWSFRLFRSVLGFVGEWRVPIILAVVLGGILLVMFHWADNVESKGRRTSSPPVGNGTGAQLPSSQEDGGGSTRPSAEIDVASPASQGQTSAPASTPPPDGTGTTTPQTDGLATKPTPDRTESTTTPPSENVKKQPPAALSPAAAQALAATGSKLYLVVDLSGGTKATDYPCTYLDRAPEGGWTDEYKTTKLVLRRIEPGSFQMGADKQCRQVTLTHPYYIGVFEVTQRQYELVMGTNPSKDKGEMRPVGNLSYYAARGKKLGDQWPQSDEVDGDSFLGRLRSKAKLKFDLPTEAQWAYACNAGTDVELKSKDDFEEHLFHVARFALNQRQLGWQDHRLDNHRPDGRGGYDECTTVVGSYDPNPWGLYDMYGNVWEWCVDRWKRASSEAEVDPRGGGMDCPLRIRKGGCWNNQSATCRSNFHEFSREKPTNSDAPFGIRVSYTIEGESSKTKLEAGATCKVVLPGGEEYEMVWCPPCPDGFMMGSPEKEKGRRADERRHRVRLTRGFWLGKSELTQAQWKSVMGFNPSRFNKDPRCPVERVTLNECRHFLLKTGSSLRLPTEAEWEYACRAGDDDAVQVCEMVWCADNSNAKTHPPVDKKTENAWGLYDMLGNVAEWVGDFYGEYPAEEFNPTVTQFATNRVARGGGWSSRPDECRPAARTALGPDMRYEHVGVRLAMDESMQDIAGASSLVVQAQQWGKKLSNAKLWLKDKTVPLPHTIRGLSRGMFTEPYVVSCMVNGNHYEGNVAPMLVDWVGTRTNVVELVQCKDKVLQRAGADRFKTLDLGNDAAPLEFVYCPSGKFMMHADEESPYMRHEVKITRPFWMMKYKLTYEQLAQENVSHPRTDEDILNTPAVQMVGGRQMPAVRIWRSAILEYCKVLTKKYRSQLPSGYVVRLPTSAEWEYAYRAGAYDVNDPYGPNSKASSEVRAGISFSFDEYKRWCTMWNCSSQAKSPNFGGLKRANRWGVHDLATCSEGVLDQLPITYQGIDAASTDGKNRIAGFLNYGYREEDPLRIHDSGLGINRSLAMLDVWWDRIWKDDKLWNGGGWRSHSYRLVIAPPENKLNRIEVKQSYPENENRKPGTSKTVILPGGVKLELVWCPPCPNGFNMGSPLDEPNRNDKETQHLVKLTRGFWIGKYEVTQEQWASVMETMPAQSKNDKHPVEQVSWEACNEFCRKVGWLRLPTEAEWEYACRADDKDRQGKLGEMAWFKDNSSYRPHSYGTMRPNAWNLHDMYGNVWEWCQDVFHDYPLDSVSVDPVARGNGDRVVRGGAFDCEAARCRAAARRKAPQNHRDKHTGFRVVLTTTH